MKTKAYVFANAAYYDIDDKDCFEKWEEKSGRNKGVRNKLLCT